VTYNMVGSKIDALIANLNYFFRLVGYFVMNLLIFLIHIDQIHIVATSIFKVVYIFLIGMVETAKIYRILNLYRLSNLRKELLF